jgi:uncharacterized protein (DUF111 family)
MERIGYGAGSRDPDAFPNALRMVLGEVEEGGKTGQPAEQESAGEQAGLDSEAQEVIVIETNIDDMNPQVYGFVMERAFALGALDIFLTPVQMKKDRPAVKLTALCERSRFEALAELILSQTTTLGLRYYEAKRRTLGRRVETVETDYGEVRVKIAAAGERVIHFQAEYEDCAKLAEKLGVPLLEVQAAANAAFREKGKKG